MIRLALAATLCFALCTTPGLAQPSHDVVLANGRVMDPESGLDAVRYVGITDGRIAAISAEPLEGQQVIDLLFVWGGLAILWTWCILYLVLPD